MAKLVRDRIPEIIRSSGRAPITHTADDAEYLASLKAKVVEEEAEELRVADMHDEVGEMTDTFEVLRALAAARGVPWGTVERSAAAKNAERGVFNERIILERVEELGRA